MSLKLTSETDIISLFWIPPSSNFLINHGVNYGTDTTGEKEKRTSKKTWMDGVQAAMTSRNLEPDQRINREEWCLASGRRRQLLKIPDR
jgi:hypothetical protein